MIGPDASDMVKSGKKWKSVHEGSSRVLKYGSQYTGRSWEGLGLP